MYYECLFIGWETKMGFNCRWWVVSLCLVCATVIPLSAQDWPHWMGPEGTNEWKTTGLIDRFPDGGPTEVWSAPVGLGYSGPAVAAGRVFVTDFRCPDDVKISNFERREFDGVERVICLDEKTGKTIWEQSWDVRYTISYPSGPRCTPVVDEDRVYVLGAEGNLACFQVTDGKVLWSKSLKDEYGTRSALWGYAAHPLVDGEQLFTLAGGKGSHLVALNKRTGEENWRALTAPEQGYAPPKIIEAGGVRQLITLRPDAISSVDPATGKEYWSLPYEATSGSIIMTPVFFDDFLYVAGYSQQSQLLRLASDRPAAEKVWENKARDAISPVNVQPYFDPESKILYGCHQNGEFRATQLPAGELVWSTPQPISERPVGSGTAFVVRQGDRFWLFNESGELIIAKMSAAGYEEIDRARVIEPSNNAFNRPVVWSMPAFANQRVYIRNDDKLICLDLAADSD